MWNGSPVPVPEHTTVIGTIYAEKILPAIVMYYLEALSQALHINQLL